jgi:hypothetical protein
LAEPSHSVLQQSILQLGERVDRGFEALGRRVDMLDGRTAEIADTTAELRVDGERRGAAIESLGKDLSHLAAKVDELAAAPAEAAAPWYAKYIPSRDMILALAAGLGLGATVAIALMVALQLDLAALSALLVR